MAAILFNNMQQIPFSITPYKFRGNESYLWRAFTNQNITLFRFIQEIK